MSWPTPEHVKTDNSKDEDFPKWVAPHASHVDRIGDHVSVPHFPEFHVDRKGNLTVLVRDAEEESRALAEKVAEEGAGGEKTDSIGGN